MPPQLGERVVLTTRAESQMIALHIPDQQAFALQVPADPFADPIRNASPIAAELLANKS
jgi:hypothetical protein